MSLVKKKLESQLTDALDFKASTDEFSEKLQAAFDSTPNPNLIECLSESYYYYYYSVTPRGPPSFVTKFAHFFNGRSSSSSSRSTSGHFWALWALLGTFGHYMYTCIMDTFIMNTCIMYTCIMDTCTMHTCIMGTCIMDTCIMDTSAWVTRPERPKGAKDEVKRPKGPPTRLLV